MTRNIDDESNPNSNFNQVTSKLDIVLDAYDLVCLMNLNFYEIGMEMNEDMTTIIVQRLCYDNDRVSLRLMNLSIQKLYNERVLSMTAGSGSVSMSGSSSSFDKSMHILDFLKILLSIPDSFLSQRMESLLFLKEVGLFKVIRSEL